MTAVRLDTGPGEPAIDPALAAALSAPLPDISTEDCVPSIRGRDVWVTRKGAIKADTGDEGVIPGSMGTRSYIVKGKGNPASYNSCSHGAGRRMSRGQARKALSVESLAAAMGDRTWNADKARVLLDEHPEACKDIDVVMADQADLVEIQHTLRQVFNYKGT